jgi:hypothetical protein
MFRSESGNGWWLITHPDHARLAGQFAEHWGNERFLVPEPRADLLEAIRTHDDGWALRDAAPEITKQGKPSALSSDLIGSYSTFNEIDLLDYLEVRREAVDTVVHRNRYAGLLVSLHTSDLLARADRSTFHPSQLPFLDAFLENQKALQRCIAVNAVSAGSDGNDISPARIEDHFHLLLACDDLSFFTCIDYRGAASVLPAVPVIGNGREPVTLQVLGMRHFGLEPYPLDISPLTFEFPARFIQPLVFGSNEELRDKFYVAEVQRLAVTVERTR